jgi:hypothetical protein
MRHWLALILSLCVACNKSVDTKNLESRCDQAALVALSEAVGKVSRGDRGAIAWTGIQAACGSSLPGSFGSYYDAPGRLGARVAEPDVDDARLTALIGKACPSWPTLGPAVADAPAYRRGDFAYEHCGFDRYRVVDGLFHSLSPAVVTWALHQWLLDQGADPAHLAPITRAMLELDDGLALPVHRVDNLRLPSGPGSQIDEGFAVYVTPDELRFGDRVLVELEGGKCPESVVVDDRLAPLYDALVAAADEAKRQYEPRGEDWGGTLLLAADVETPATTAIAVMHTAAAAGYPRFAFVVDSSVHGLARLPFNTPEFDVPDARIPDAGRVVISTKPGMSIQPIVAAIVAAHGECGPDRECVPEVLISVGNE